MKYFGVTSIFVNVFAVEADGRVEASTNVGMGLKHGRCVGDHGFL